MYMSAAIKTSLDGGDVFFYAFSENLEVPFLPNLSKQIDISDYAVAGILSPFFLPVPIGSALASRYPFIRRIALSGGMVVDPNEDASIALGQVMSSSTNPIHSDTVSMTCFTESSLRDFLANSFISSEFMDIETVSTFTETINNTPMNQLGSALSNLLTNLMGGGAQFAITIIKDPKLTISRLSQSDLDTVGNDFLGTVQAPFFDAFDLIKERVTRQEPSLNSNGYAPAVYTDNGGDGSNDTIVFTGGYGFSERRISQS